MRWAKYSGVPQITMSQFGWIDLKALCQDSFLALLSKAATCPA
jgi:hypothetical protein